MPSRARYWNYRGTEAIPGAHGAFSVGERAYVYINGHAGGYTRHKASFGKGHRCGRVKEIFAGEVTFELSLEG